jgi:hypothetical protein
MSLLGPPSRQTLAISRQDLRTVTWKFTPAPPDQRHIVGACESASRPTCLRASGETLPLVAASDLRGDVGTCTDLALRDAFAEVIEDRAQKRGGCSVEHGGLRPESHF